MPILVIPEATYRFKPTGEWHMPTSMLTTIRMPKCTGSMPNFIATGNKIGSMINTIDDDSITLTAKSKSTFTTSWKQIGSHINGVNANVLAKRLPNEGDVLCQYPKIEIILQWTVGEAQWRQCPKFFSHYGVTWINQQLGRVELRQHDRAFDILRHRRDGIAKSNINMDLATRAANYTKQYPPGVFAYIGIRQCEPCRVENQPSSQIGVSILIAAVYQFTTAGGIWATRSMV